MIFPESWDADEREAFVRDVLSGLIVGLVLFTLAFLIRPAAVRAILAA